MTINLFPGPTKWLVRLSKGYNQKLNDWMKQIPGCQWDPDKKYWVFPVDMLEELFHDRSVFVHMGGSWGKERELEIIRSGGIHYKKADIHEVSVNVIGNTAVLLNKITLLAVVGGKEVTNPFMVTEVYKQEDGDWKLASLSFTKLLESD